MRFTLGMKMRAVPTQSREGAEPRTDFAPPARKKQNRHEYQERLSHSLLYSYLFCFLRGPRPRPTKVRLQAHTSKEGASPSQAYALRPEHQG